MATQSKILIFGGTGYIGKYMVKASLSMGHPTYVYVRPTFNNNNISRLELLQEFKSMGVKIFQGNLDEHEKLVSALRQVDIVISTLATPQHKDQFKILDAVKEAGNIKRFIPSEFGCETDRVSALPPFQALIDIRKEVRRATEASGIPYTFITANCYAAYFIDFLLHPQENRDEVLIYGTGEAKVVMNFEEDVAAYTIMVVNDPRTCNRIVTYRPPKNFVSQLDLISLWEKRTKKILKRNYISEEEAVALSQTLPHPGNIQISILHECFIKGDLVNMEQEEDFLEAFELYPNYDYTSIDHLLDICVVNPPKVKYAAF
ncbi:isoeugenol synthase 1-like [Magnolia sinica]|uniref:isoeugenol synthase 1-like n=1 Tax=Magnolia sinica TaxID=86752 RepID=UPI0026585F2C|nr:isoeugenol synthase 1-like [Magnolia sinica]